ncbi:MAG: T9SS type A sorting domain-containing protein [Ignavibacteriaceae bacterium]|nr:T9SS type A sorting domain-containing protein [Ignavibacteriaceae bacterium]
MKRFIFALVAVITLFLSVSATLQAQTLVDDWGNTVRGKGWPILNRMDTPAGTGIMGAAAPPPSWATIRGQFDTITIAVGETFVASGQMEYVGGGTGPSYVPLRYAVTFQDSTTLNYQYTDTASWVSSKGHYGYQITPRSGGSDLANGNGGSGTLWTVVGAQGWNSTYTNNGKPLVAVYQAPRLAEITQGVYDWAISVTALGDGTNEIRFSLVKQHAVGQPTEYWTCGVGIDSARITTKFNGVAFGVGDGITTTLTQFKVTNVTVGKGSPIDIPAAPWADFYVDQWGVVGGKTGGWKFMPDPFLLIGNAGIGGAAPNTDIAAIRGGLGGSIPLPVGKVLKFTGKIVLEGGGFEGGALRFGIFDGNAGAFQNKDTDSARWAGSEGGNKGYLFIPPAGTSSNPTWAGTAATGSWGGVISSVWYGPDSSASNYPMGTQVQSPANAVAGAGTYDFTIEVRTLGAGTNEIGCTLEKDDHSYAVTWNDIDTHSPLTKSFNCFAIGLGSWVGSTTTALKVLDVYVSQTTEYTLPVELTSFAASVSDLGVNLSWTTGAEKNNYGFEVQKKTSNSSYSTIGFVKGHGTTTEKSSYSFTDKNPEAGKYFYRLKQVDLNGQFNYSKEVEIDVKPAYQFALDQNYPNPFNPTTTISFTLPEKSMAKLVILNAIGEEVAVLLNEEQEAGYHKINFNGLNLTSGVYFYKLIAKDFTSVKKLMLVK